MKKKNIIALIVVAILLIAVGIAVFSLTRDRANATEYECGSCGSENVTTQIIKEATCTESGIIRIACGDCGKITDTELSAGHLFTKATNCPNIMQCSRTGCNETTGSHDIETRLVGTASICYEQGCAKCDWEDGGKPHTSAGKTPVDYKTKEGQHAPGYACINTGCTYVIYTSYVGCSDDGIVDGKCDSCGQEVEVVIPDEPCGHNAKKYKYNNTEHWLVCANPDCNEDLYETTKGPHSFLDGVCICGYACQHSSTTTSGAVAPTCTKQGFSGVTVCTNCGKQLSAGGAEPALNHIGAIHANGGTCTRLNNGVVCGVVYETHSQSTKVKDYSKTETGHTPIYGCTFANCTGEYTGTEASHTYTNGVCTVCNYVCTHPAKTAKNDATHHWEECNNCGEELNKEQHTYTDGECECGKTEENTTCEHNYQIDKAGATETKHWEKCTKCEDKRNTANHTFTNGVCTVCDYVCTHKTKINKKDNTHHWEECNNCGEELNKEQHTYTDGECECGKTEENTTCEHNYQIDKAGATETQHWEKCTKCGDKRNTVKHTFENGVCKVCNYICEHKTTTGKKDNTYHWEECNNCGHIVNKEQHTYEGGKCECGKDEAIKECEHKNKEWKSNETEHWQVCKDCGKEIDGTREKHSYKDDKCTDCGIKDSTSKQDKIPNTGIDTVTVSIVVVTAFAVVGLAGIKKYREF